MRDRKTVIRTKLYAVDLPDWRIHDLRHTFITRSRDGEENTDGEIVWSAPLDVVQATVNHESSSGITKPTTMVTSSAAIASRNESYWTGGRDALATSSLATAVERRLCRCDEEPLPATSKGILDLPAICPLIWARTWSSNSCLFASVIYLARRACSAALPIFFSKPVISVYASAFTDCIRGIDLSR